MAQPAWFNALNWRAVLKLAVFIAFLVCANIATHWLAESLNFQIRPGNEDLVHRTIMMMALLYALLLAMPFIPGAEIGLALIAMLGAPIAPLVYICTLVGLSISFLVGRLIPLGIFVKISSRLGFKRLTDLLKSIEHLDRDEMLAHLAARAPNRYLPLLLRHRYILLALALNLPGNFLLGGGGGIALFAGFSRLYSAPLFLATIALAVAPVPLLVFFFGIGFLSD